MVTHSDKGVTFASAREPAPNTEQRRPAWQRVPSWLRLPAPSRLPSWRTLAVAALVVLLVFGGVRWLLAIQADIARNNFVVLVAPFASTSSDRTGDAVAQSLVSVLRESNIDTLEVHKLDRAPADAQEAQTLAAQHDADALVWGSVSPGGMLDDDTLQPRLTYAPTGVYAPHVWDGYSGRFSIDGTYTISDQPINGAVVLPRLLTALVDYSSGQSDIAYDKFGLLLEDYPLDGTLLRALRGNTLWARGDYGEAAAEYCRALRGSQPWEQAQYEQSPTSYCFATAQPSLAQAALANNLAAILLDAGDSRAPDTLIRVAQLLGEGQDLGTLRTNLGLLAMQQGRYADAIAEFEQARVLLPETAPLLLASSHAYRDQGQLEAASSTLDMARSQVSQAVESVPDHLQTPQRLRLEAALAEQHALLELAHLVDARGPLAWELEIVPPQPHDTLASIVADLRSAVETSGELAREWEQRTTADDAARRSSGQAADPEAQLVSSGQQQRAASSQNRQQYHLSLALIEQARAPEMQDTGFLASIWHTLTGVGNPLQDAQTTLAVLLEANENNVPALLARARALRVQQEATEDALAQANGLYDQVIAIAPTQPEAYYGKGAVALANGDRDASAQLMIQALEQNSRFFPARIQLIQFAEQAGDWGTALLHLRTLAEHYPRPDAQLAIATALRRSGSTGFDEAEQLLQQLVADDAASDPTRVAALVELGRLYRATNQLERAIQVLEQARSIDSSAPTAALELGRILVQQGDFERAEDLLLVAIDNSAGNLQAQARLEVAELYAGPLDRPDEAARYYEQIAQSDTQNAAILVQAGTNLLNYNNATAAVAALSSADTLQQSGDAATAQHLARAYLEMGDLAQAEAAAQRVLELTADTGDNATRAAALVVLGDVQRRTGDFASATNQYNQALLLDPQQVDAAIGLGLIAVAQDNWGVALGQFERAANFPNGQTDPLAQFWYAEALLRQSNPRLSTERYAQALTLRPEFPEALLGAAQAHNALGNTDRAQQTVAEALQQRPDYAEALIFQGRLLHEQRLLDEALGSYTHALRANDQLAEAHYRRGLIYIEQGAYERAQNDLQRTVELEPDNAEAYYWLGRANLVLNRNSQALAAFQRAVELRGGNYDEARFYQGLAETALDRYDEARTSFQTVVQTASDNEWVNRARSELEQIGQ
jgi:tetratricopeptide (TPR) repeat protein